MIVYSIEIERVHSPTIITEVLRKRKGEMSSATASDKQTSLDVVHIEDDEGDAPHPKIRKPEFTDPPDKEGPSYTVMVL